MKNLLKISLLFLFFTACSEDSEEGILCDPGPVMIDLLVLEEGTEVNLIETGVYSGNQISIEDKEGETVDYDLSGGKTISVVLGWEGKTDTYTVSLGEEVVFEIAFTLESSTENSCTVVHLEQLEIIGIAHEPGQAGLYTYMFRGNRCRWGTPAVARGFGCPRVVKRRGMEYVIISEKFLTFPEFR